MPEWWTYSLSDFLMFSGRTWYRLLELHNREWLPMQALTSLALLAIAARIHTRSALALAGAAWLFVAWAFHASRYAQVNWAANYFAIAFGLQGLLLLGFAALQREPPGPAAALARRTGQAMLGVALLYPLLAPALGRTWAASEWFGLTPDPTALATLGLLLGAGRRWLLPVPLLWCAISGATLWTLHAPEWWLLPLAGALAVAVSIGRRRPAATNAGLAVKAGPAAAAPPQEQSTAAGR